MWPRALRLWRPPVRPAGRRGTRCRDRWRSRRIPVGMAKRFAGVLAGDGEDQHTGGPAVGDDDVRLARIAVPLERDGEVEVVSGVELHEHAWLLVAAPLSHSRAARSGDLTAQACASSTGITHVSTRGCPTGMYHRSPLGGDSAGNVA